jgi:hypothetical protein
LDGDFYGGKHRGQWQADLRSKPAVCSGSGGLKDVSLTELAGAMKNNWISGTADTNYEMKGPCAEEFWKSVEGSVKFDVRNGTLPRGALEIVPGGNAESFRVTDFAGQAQLHGGEVAMKDGKLDSPDGKFQVSGTVSSKGELDLQLTGNANGVTAAGYTITGTLAEPRVIRLAGAETQARLKP